MPQANTCTHTHTHTQEYTHTHTYFTLNPTLTLTLTHNTVTENLPLFFPQDRHVTRNGDTEPVVDPSQDYMLMLGYENATHTVLRFRRKLDTCDASHDIAITVSTVDV